MMAQAIPVATAVTVKDVSDLLAAVPTAPRVVELIERDHVVVGGVGRRNHRDSLRDMRELGAAFRVGRVKLALHSWGVRVRRKPAVAPVVEVIE